MSARTWGAALALLLLQGAPAPVAGQTLARRIAAAPAGAVAFSFATRDGVCGDGRSYVRYSADRGSSFYGSFNDLTDGPCVRGAARVVLERAGDQILAVRVYVGPPAADAPAATSLGAVSTREAAAYLLGLASSGEGAVARDALMPAMLADSVDNRDALLALARDRSRPREIRRNALSWLGRDSDTGGTLAQSLVAIASDESDNQSVRQQALSTLARFSDGSGIPMLIRLAGDPSGGWMGRTALSVIAQSGDPRARDYLRGIVEQAALPDEALAVAVRSFGQQYATAADIKTIRDTWSRFTGQRTQDAAIGAVAEFGGRDNAAWLLDLARSMNTTAGVRRRAIDAANRAGATTGDLSSLYDAVTDPDTKSAIISALAEIGDRAATDKLLSIARGDADVSARRRAVSALGRFSDPRVKDALAGIAIGRN